MVFSFISPFHLCFPSSSPLSRAVFLRQRSYRGQRLSLVNNPTALAHRRHSMQTRLEMCDSLGWSGTLKDVKIGFRKDLALVLSDPRAR